MTQSCTRYPYLANASGRTGYIPCKVYARRKLPILL